MGIYKGGKLEEIMGEILEEFWELIQDHSEVVRYVYENKGGSAAIRYSFVSGAFTAVYCGAFLIDFVLSNDPIVSHTPLNSRETPISEGSFAERNEERTRGLREYALRGRDSN